ncbi:DUF6263 family protein, partial [uncultured Dokdonia sp.]|uniref:DUF6263 family protein n=1 Tax=uncultured Dokdonia sp. TaxID=575653 RepID=UPI0026306480
MITKNTLFSLLFLVVSYISIGQVYLGYSLDMNDEFKLQQDVLQTITQDIQGNMQEIENKLRGSLYFVVKEKTKENITLDVGFKSFYMKTTSPQLGGVLMEVDTQAEEQTPESKMFMGLIDSSIGIVINYSGKIIEVKNGDAFINNMLSGMGIEDPTLLEQTKKQLEKDWSGESLGRSFEQVLFNYPNAKVNQGDTWNNEFVSKTGLNATNTWTLVTIDADSYQISGTADVYMKTSNAQITMDLSGTQQTNLIADSKNKFPRKMTVTSTV